MLGIHRTFSEKQRRLLFISAQRNMRRCSRKAERELAVGDAYYARYYAISVTECPAPWLESGNMTRYDEQNYRRIIYQTN